MTILSTDTKKQLTQNQVGARQKNLASRARHDLLQPLAAMRMLLARVGDEISEAERNTLLETFSAALTGLEGSLESIVQHLFLQHSVMGFTPAQVNLDEWLEALCSQYVGKFDAEDIAFHLNTQVGEVRCDEELLKIVIESALDNAFDFTKSGSVTLTTDRRGETVLIMIKDTGIGVYANSLPRLCEPFYVENAAASRSMARLGLGLANASDAAQLMSADIRLSPNDDYGSTFEIAI
ncbi:MAG: HAMP domain-containing sensor histidine kinase [Pseudomonadota bacterium]